MSQEVLASEIEAFISAFRVVGNGEIAEETSRKLKACVKATMIQEKKTTLTIKLEIAKVADDQITIIGYVSAKIPEPSIKTGFFVNDRTFLPTRNRPEQTSITRNDIMKELIEKIVNAFRPVIQDLNNGRTAVHQDYKVDEFDKPIHYKPLIDRHVLNANIINKLDFIAFVNEYKTEATKLFYNDTQIKAIFNYTTKDTPDHGDSICAMQLQVTDDYSEFRKHQAQLTQKQFVRFLKRMEPYIVAFDNKPADDMDIIEMAEHLQAIKTIDSVQRNAQQKFHLDVNIQTGKASMTLPKVIVFKFPIFKNDRDMTTRFETELFLSADEGALSAELICYNIDQLYEESIRELTTSILQDIENVSAFQS